MVNNYMEDKCMEMDLENLDEKSKAAVIGVLKKIIQDMTKMSAESLLPKEEMAEPVGGMELVIEAKPLDEEEAKTKVKDMIGDVMPMEEEEDEELKLPRWKRRQKSEA